MVGGNKERMQSWQLAGGWRCFTFCSSENIFQGSPNFPWWGEAWCSKKIHVAKTYKERSGRVCSPCAGRDWEPGVCNHL